MFAVGLTGWLSLRNGQKAVNNVASQLLNGVTTRVDEHLENYLKIYGLMVIYLSLMVNPNQLMTLVFFL